MQTRAAALEAAEAATGDVAKDGATDPPGIGPLSLQNAPNSGESASTLKRKRSTTTIVSKPTKGGWDVLPHGMGILAAVPAAAGPSKVAEDLDATSSQIDGSITVTTTEKATGKTAESGPRRQTRIVNLKVTKPIAKVLAKKTIPAGGSAATEIAPSVDNRIKNEDTEWAKPAEGDEDGTQNKRQRMTRAVARATQDPIIVKHDMRVPNGLSPSDVDSGATAGDSKSASNDGLSEMKAISNLDPDFKARIKRGAGNPYGLTLGYSPYSHRSVPSPEACEEVHRILSDLHGEVTQPQKMPAPSLLVAGCGEVPSVLDALLRTLISGNTLMARADDAIKGLVKKFGVLEHGIGAGSINWDKVRLSPLEHLVAAIKPAGCAHLKGKQIKTILDMVHEENAALAAANNKVDNKGLDTVVAGAEENPEGQKALEVEKANQGLLSLDYFHGLSKEEAMTRFLKFPGIGVKTSACVILFCLRTPCFAVDTHVHKFCQWLGWVPAKATELDSFNHGEFKVPDHLKYGLHQLFIRHGQQCFKCRKATKPGTTDWTEAPDCPLEHLLDRSKDGAKGKDESREESEE